MKKLSLVLAGILLVGGISFAQTGTTTAPAKSKTTKTETTKTASTKKASSKKASTKKASSKTATPTK